MGPTSLCENDMYRARGVVTVNSARCFLKYTVPMSLTNVRNPLSSLPGAVSASVPGENKLLGRVYSWNTYQARHVFAPWCMSQPVIN